MEDAKNITGVRGKKEGETNSLYAISNIVSFVFIIIVVVVIYCWRKFQSHKKKLKKITKAEIEKFFDGDFADEINGLDPDSNVPFSLPYDKKFEIAHENFILDKTNLLGAGAYVSIFYDNPRGIVYKGRLPNENSIAIKTLKPNADIMYFKSLLSELKVMLFVAGHENIINCFGACTADIISRKLYIMMEHCTIGSLEMFLREHRNDFSQFTKRLSSTDYQNVSSLSEILANANRNANPNGITSIEALPTKIDNDARIEKMNEKADRKSGTINLELKKPHEKLTARDLLKYSCEICNGMEYLAGKKVVHGDLATRNILLNESKTVKITDFGLSRHMINYSTYIKAASKQKNPLPWRWLALETIKSLTFSTKSDVWAFGVTLWEVFSLAQVPYPGLAYSHDFVQKLENGLRMNSPSDFTPVEIWHSDPDERPTFQELKIRLLDLKLEVQLSGK